MRFGVAGHAAGLRGGDLGAAREAGFAELGPQRVQGGFDRHDGGEAPGLRKLVGGQVLDELDERPAHALGVVGVTEGSFAVWAAGLNEGLAAGGGERLERRAEHLGLCGGDAGFEVGETLAVVEHRQLSALECALFLGLELFADDLVSAVWVQDLDDVVAQPLELVQGDVGCVIEHDLLGVAAFFVAEPVGQGGDRVGDDLGLFGAEIPGGPGQPGGLDLR